mgnify:CR=1 FL=1
MKKIAIIIQNLNGGGAERTAANLSLYFSEKYEVHLIVFDGRVINYPHGGMLHDLKVYPSKSKVQKAINVIRRVIKTSLLKRKYGIEATISLMEESNIVNLLSNSGDKKITSIRNFESKSSYNSFFEKIVMSLVRHKSDCVVALSKGVEDDLVDNCGIPKDIVTTIYNPCDGELLREKAKKHADDAKKMVEYSVSTMGRLTNQKGQWHLIRAFKKVVEEIPEAKLYIFGQGILEEKLKKLASDLDIANNVEFMGFVEAPHAYIANSKAFVFPSLYEGLGNVLLEAMACGVACVATDCYSGPREVMAPGTKVMENLDDIECADYGILVSVGDKEHFNEIDPLTKAEEQLAKAIVVLLTDAKKRKKYEMKALERAKAFSPDAVMAEWKKLL